MIEIFGVSLAWETLAWAGAFVASEVIGASRLKENSVAAVIKTFIDRMRPFRKEDEKVDEIVKRIDELTEELKSIGK